MSDVIVAASLAIVLQATAGNIPAGYGIVPSTDKRSWVVASAANMSAVGYGHAPGILLQAASGGQAAQVQFTGYVPSSVTAGMIGIGSETFVEFDATGRLVRNALSTSQTAGIGLADGAVILVVGAGLAGAFSGNATLLLNKPIVGSTVNTSHMLAYTSLGNWVNRPDWAVNVTDFGAVGDGVTNDTPAFQAAADFAASLRGSGKSSGRRVHIPYKPLGYALLTPLVMDKAPSGALHWGVEFIGEGGSGISTSLETPTLLCGVPNITSTTASLGTIDGAGHQTISGGFSGLDSSIIGKKVQILGAFSASNCYFAIQVTITQVLSSSSFTVYNPGGVAGDTNNGAITVKILSNTIDVRARGCRFTQLTISQKANTDIGCAINWTMSPDSGAGIQTRLTLRDVMFAGVGLTNATQFAWMRVADTIIPKAGNTYYNGALAVQVPVNIDNCDFILAYNTQWRGGTFAAVYCENNSGQSREHIFEDCGMTLLPYGWYAPASAGNMPRFARPTFGCTDTNVVLGNSTSNLAIHGGLCEAGGRLIKYVGSGTAPTIVTVRDMNFGANAASVHPSNQVCTLGGPGVFSFEQCRINMSSSTRAHIRLTNSAGGREGRLSVSGCTIPSSMHTAGQRPLISCPRLGPFPLTNGMTLTLQIRPGSSTETVTFNTALFASHTAGGGLGTAIELAAQITAQCAGAGHFRAWGEADGGLFIEGLTDTTDPGNGTTMLIRLDPATTGGTANPILGISATGSYTSSSSQSQLNALTSGLFDSVSNGAGTDSPLVLSSYGNSCQDQSGTQQFFAEGSFVLGVLEQSNRHNEKGQDIIADPATFVDVTFTRPMPDSSTYVVPPVSLTVAGGTPNTALLHPITISNRTKMGFRITLGGGAPGGGNTVFCNWMAAG